MCLHRLKKQLIDLALKEIQEECTTDKEKRENVLINNQEVFYDANNKKKYSIEIQFKSEKSVIPKLIYTTLSLKCF